MEKEFIIIDNYNNKDGNVTELKESDGKIIVKQFSGTNTENFIIKKFNGKRLKFSLFKLNNIYYVNINGDHIVDYKHFINIQHITKVEEDVKIKNHYMGEIVVKDCDIDIVYRALTIMSDWIKSKQNALNDIMYYIFH